MSLDLLRGDPKSACMRNVYRTSPAGGSFVSSGAKFEGGNCTITCDPIAKAKGFYDLTATAANGTTNDYFFPWLQRGVGWVRVPENLPDGLIVMTGGVNGCTLVATKSDGYFYFYHDGGSKYLQPADLVGTQVAKVQPKDYDPLEWGQKKFTDALAEAALKGVRPMGDISYGHFVIAVKKGGRYGFYATGLMSLNGLTKLPFAVTPCIVTFS